MFYQLQTLSLWRTGWLAWMSPLGSGPLLRVEDRHFCSASPSIVLISPMHLQELWRHWSAVMHTQGLGLTLVYQGCFARKYLQLQKGLLLWPDIEWGGTTIWDQGAQIPNRVLLQVKRNLFSICLVDSTCFIEALFLLETNVLNSHGFFFTRQVPKLCPLLQNVL